MTIFSITKSPATKNSSVMFAWQHAIVFVACILRRNTVTAHNDGDHGDHTEHSHLSIDPSHQHVRRLASDGKIKRCSTRDPTTADFQVASKVVEKYMAKKLMLQSESRQASPVEIDMYFHVVTAGNIGTVTNEQLLLQLQAINDSFSPYGFSFRLLGNTTTDNANWLYAKKTSSAQTEMKKALRVGDTASTLNAYFNGAADLYGYATYPWEYTSNPDDDGVVINYGTVPLGYIERFNEGLTLVHEVGHWLGLFHTFQGRCSVLGDGVRDTPRQRSSTSGCPMGRDSCPLSPGLDPIDNYMDYSDDPCYTSFTLGQQDRMMAMWEEYRANENR